MAYYFRSMPRIYMAIAQEDRHPIIEIMAARRQIYLDSSPAAIFPAQSRRAYVGDAVTSKERDYMVNIYASDKQARVST